ncbi:presenilin family intramembrane aspartyl protease [Candidatus Poseidoniales archaeon]|nr:presenilin family intramembrane aspartyl protease [Candidatus Poseidoniales archaeon]MDB2624104.1 presenilin family intramembrane aspartyl protease [Candidatus Poseidoniales archaeon]
MTNDDSPSTPRQKAQAQASKEFQAMEAQLREEDSLWSMMKEQMTSMLGMVGMFILTIVLALFIRPWYDIGGLHAFGDAGATQVRYIALELVMIFVFTAFILMLAKYKKDWVIKYGIMGVLALALMYSTVPLAHMIMMDFESDPYTIEEETSFDSELLTHSGFDGHLMSTLTGTAGTWGDTITYYEGNNMSDNTSTWTNSHERYPAGDGNQIHATIGDGVFTFANGAWVWYVDATTGETIDSFACHQWVTTDGENNSEFLPEIGLPCTLAFTTDDAMYIVDEGNFIHRFNTFDESPGLIVKQATWRLPAGLDAHKDTVYAESLANDKIMIVSPTMAVVIELEEFSQVNDQSATKATNFAKVVFQHNATSTITSADFGPSPWSSAVYNGPDSGEEIMLLGEENGDVIGFEWNASATPEFTNEEGMRLEGFGTSIQSVRLVDKDATGYTELLVTTNTQSHWLYGGNLIQKLSIDIEEGFSTGWFSTDADGDDQFNALYSNSSSAVKSGEVTPDMEVISGLQLYDVPLVIGVLVALVLMVLLYLHSEWYVVNTVGVLVGSGVVVMLGVAFVPTLIIVFMIAAAIYDAWAVYKSKHMLDLADTMIGLRLPILLVAPQDKGYSFVEETTSMKQKNQPAAASPPSGQPKKKKSKDAMFMGLGDVIFPGMLVVSAAQWIDHSDAILVAISTLIGGLIGYFALMTYVARGRAQAGLPLLNGGSILGYIVGGLIFIGTAIFDFGISF